MVLKTSCVKMSRADERAPWIKALAAKLDDLSSVSGTHTAERTRMQQDRRFLNYHKFRN